MTYAVTGWDMQDMTWEKVGRDLVRCRNVLASGIGSDRQRALADWRLGAQRGKDEYMRWFARAIQNSVNSYKDNI